MSEFKIPGGNEKGTPITEASESTLTYWVNRISGDLEKNPGKKFADRDQAWLEAARGEQARRNGEDPAEAGQPTPVQAPAKPPVNRSLATSGMSLDKVAHDPRAITERLSSYSEQYHMVTPATTVEALPPGCGISISLVQVNPDDSKTGPGDVHPVGGGKVGLSGSKLLEISSAAGVDWSPVESGRLDSGADPRYVHFRSVGYVKLFDGSMRRLIGEVEIDARDGSPQIEEIQVKAKSGGRDPASQILELRKFILRHAETKSKLRAIASMGIKRSYHKNELSKPFAVARLTWTGHSDDPELRREFARMGAERMLDGVGALYGRTHHPQLPTRSDAAPGGAPAFEGHAPPPVGATAAEDSGYDYDTSGEAY